ncbi:hypothetical protein [Glycomyces arizonensis]|uniref:hypothetical protein n=1 Tax=Glycomyces arizonensis TaxID=256035 RepID=UPI000416063C|nr:hypothetical protein [Glycomyces arizonensis]
MSTTATRPERAAWGRWLLRRWPTALAIAAGALIFAGGGVDAEFVTSFGELVPLLALEYLLIAKFGRRGWSWPVVVALSLVMAAAQIVGLLRPSLVFGAVAVVVLVWSVADGRLLKDGMYRLQVFGMIGFGALTLVAVAVDSDAARYAVAAAWLAHAVWDFVHHRLDRVVSRSYAEACGVIDLIVAAGLVFLA